MVSIEKILRLYFDELVVSKSKVYLEKFWLKEDNYKQIRDKIFDPTFRKIPDNLFKKQNKIYFQKGGALFDEEEFRSLQKFMKVTGDKFLIIQENKAIRHVTNSDFPHLQFKFPSTISWEELNNYNNNSPDISLELLWIMNKEFFVYGDSGNWGKYAACDYGDKPIDVYSFKPEYETIFKSNFDNSNEKREEIKKWIPLEYRNLLE